MKSVMRGWRFFRPDSKGLLVVLALLLLSIGANLLKPWPLAIVVDSLLQDKPLPPWLSGWAGAPKEQLLIYLSAAILALHLAQGALSASQNYLSIRIGLRGLRRVREEVFACLQRLSMRFYQGSRMGDIIYRATWDTYSFQTIFQQGVITSATATLSLIFMVVVMWKLSATLTLVAITVGPMVLLTIRFFSREMRDRGLLAQQADSQVSSHVQQTIATLPVIQSYTRERIEESRFKEYAQNAEGRRTSQHGWELLYWLAIAVVFAAGTAGIVWLGSGEVLKQQLTVGELLVFLAYLAQLYEPLNQLSHVGAAITSAGAGAQRVFEILDTPEKVNEPPAPKALPASGAPAIRFDHVSFGYDPAKFVLHDISLTAEAGQSIALIGPSGAGKSSLINLVPRFFDPGSGRVLMNDIDLRELGLRDLRTHVAWLPQEPIIIRGTIAENIGYGRPEATLVEIEAAARAANALPFIDRLPQRFQTEIGEGAASLSVGEKQRVNLARAFLKNAPVLLLDEPTNALDQESEELVIASLRQLMAGRTTLIVAHRLATIREVDKVVVLNEGRIVEAGSPGVLSQSKGYYARLTSSVS